MKEQIGQAIYTRLCYRTFYITLNNIYSIHSWKKVQNNVTVNKTLGTINFLSVFINYSIKIFFHLFCKQFVLYLLIFFIIISIFLLPNVLSLSRIVYFFQEYTIYCNTKYVVWYKNKIWNSTFSNILYDLQVYKWSKYIHILWEHI